MLIKSRLTVLIGEFSPKFKIFCDIKSHTIVAHLDNFRHGSCRFIVCNVNYTSETPIFQSMYWSREV